MRKTAIKALGSGWFSDVAFAPDGRLWLIGAFDVPGGVEVRAYSWAGLGFTDERRELTTGLLASGYGYARIDSSAGAIWFAWHDGVRAYYMTPGQPAQPLDPCQNSSPVCLGIGAIAWQGAAAAGWPVSLRLLGGDMTLSAERNGAGTGLSRIVGGEGFRVVTVDEDRGALPGSTIPCFAGDLAVGEATANVPDGGVLWQLGAERGVLWPGEFTGTPRAATAGDLVAITTGGAPGGVRVFWGTRAELLDSRVIVVPPKDPKVSANNPLPAFIAELLPRWIDAHPVPEIREGEGDDQFTERMRDWMLPLQEQIEFLAPGQGYGRKRADSGRPFGKDTIPHVTRLGSGWDGHQIEDGEGWDLFLGTSTGHPRFNPNVRSVDLAGQYFETVAAVDHLVIGPVKPPVVPPVGAVDAPAALPALADTIVTAMLARFPGYNTGSAQQRRDLTYSIVQQFAASINRRFGAKRAAPGNDRSKNAIAYEGDPLYGYVLFTEAGAPIVGAKRQSMAGQVFEAVTASDVLNLGKDPGTGTGGGNTGGGTGGGDPKPDTSTAARLEAIERQLAQLPGTFDARDAALVASSKSAAAAVEERLRALVRETEARLNQRIDGLPVPVVPGPVVAPGAPASEATLLKILAALEALQRDAA